MGMTIKGLGATISTFREIDRRSTEAAREEVRKGAYLVRDTARQLSPVDEGNLEASIRVFKDRDQATAFRMKIRMGGSMNGVNVNRYAFRMHEGSYNLGPGSRAKAARLGVNVGPKFLFRAFMQHKSTIENNVRVALQRAVREASIIRRR